MQLSRAKQSDVALRAGVLLAKASRSINHPEKVKPELRERAMRAAQQLADVRNGWPAVARVHDQFRFIKPVRGGSA